MKAAKPLKKGSKVVVRVMGLTASVAKAQIGEVIEPKTEVYTTGIFQKKTKEVHGYIVLLPSGETEFFSDVEVLDEAKMKKVNELIMLNRRISNVI